MRGFRVQGAWGLSSGLEQPFAYWDLYAMWLMEVSCIAQTHASQIAERLRELGFDLHPS